MDIRQKESCEKVPNLKGKTMAEWKSVTVTNGNRQRGVGARDALSSDKLEISLFPFSLEKLQHGHEGWNNYTDLSTLMHSCSPIPYPGRNDQHNQSQSVIVWQERFHTRKGSSFHPFLSDFFGVFSWGTNGKYTKKNAFCVGGLS